MTWSRLEGLLLHWAVSRKPPPAEKWELPPRGWKTLPDTTVDAGEALCVSEWVEGSQAIQVELMEHCNRPRQNKPEPTNQAGPLYGVSPLACVQVRRGGDHRLRQ